MSERTGEPDGYYWRRVALVTRARCFCGWSCESKWTPSVRKVASEHERECGQPVALVIEHHEALQSAIPEAQPHA